jgi:hypothetical protein
VARACLLCYILHIWRDRHPQEERDAMLHQDLFCFQALKITGFAVRESGSVTCSTAHINVLHLGNILRGCARHMCAASGVHVSLHFGGFKCDAKDAKRLYDWVALQPRCPQSFLRCLRKQTRHKKTHPSARLIHVDARGHINRRRKCALLVDKTIVHYTNRTRPSMKYLMRLGVRYGFDHAKACKISKPQVPQMVALAHYLDVITAAPAVVAPCNAERRLMDTALTRRVLDASDLFRLRQFEQKTGKAARLQDAPLLRNPAPPCYQDFESWIKTRMNTSVQQI